DEISILSHSDLDKLSDKLAHSGKITQEEVLALMRSVDFIAACSNRTEKGLSGDIIIQTFPAKKGK
ncbi:MAG: hypothetical protein D3916_08540, partial [Candidatus Electrothrix sp. MAN1_4]|nr:hypothetical protein [Candidatus Electrothrix sp. MAN1_4]